MVDGASWAWEELVAAEDGPCRLWQRPPRELRVLLCTVPAHERAPWPDDLPLLYTEPGDEGGCWATAANALAYDFGQAQWETDLRLGISPMFDEPRPGYHFIDGYVDAGNGLHQPPAALAAGGDWLALGSDWEERSELGPGVFAGEEDF